MTTQKGWKGVNTGPNGPALAITVGPSTRNGSGTTFEKVGFERVRAQFDLGVAPNARRYPSADPKLQRQWAKPGRTGRNGPNG